MSSCARVLTVGLAMAAAAGLAACGSSSHDGGGSGGGLSGSPPCAAVGVPQNWSGIYTACAAPGGAYVQVTNHSDWDVLRLQVPAGEVLPQMKVDLPQFQGLMDAVEQTGFSNAVPPGAGYALVPPDATLEATSAGSDPVYLNVGIDYRVTAEYVTSVGFVDAINSRLNPGEAGAQAIVSCANFVGSVHQEYSQWQLSSLAFWQSFSGIQDCRGAYGFIQEALGIADNPEIDGRAVTAAADATGDFFDSVLPKLEGLLGEALFR